MGLFGFGKKKTANEATPVYTCQCSGTTVDAPAAEPVKAVSGTLSIQVLGTGCASCHALLENTKAAVSSMGLDVNVEYVTDMAQIAGYGVMRVPALMVNGKPVVLGKVPNPEELVKLLKQSCFQP